MTAVALLRAAGNGLAKRAANASAGVAAAAQQVRAPAAIARAVQIFTGIVLPQPPWTAATALVPSRRAND